MLGDHAGLDLEHRGEDLAFADLRVRQRPHDRHPGRGAHQIQAQAPEEREWEAQ
jgi:hypothetical protein